MKRLELITDLRKVLSNARFVRFEIDRNVKILAVVKADAYGHGSVQVAKMLEKEALCDYFAVATVAEGVRLREAGVQKEILILGYSDIEEMECAVNSGLIVTVYSKEALMDLNSVSKKSRKIAKAHLKIETGMHRIGVLPGEDLIDLLNLWKNMPNVQMDGIFSHFSSAESSPEYSKGQFERFVSACKTAYEYGFAPVRHMAASSAMFSKQYQLDMVREGIDLYGGSEDDGCFVPAQTLKTHPVRLLKIKKGEKVGYGMNYTCTRDTVVMTVPCGYADGYPRNLSNRAQVLVNGRRAPIIGNICMDMLMADVTDAGEIDLNSEVILLGEQKGERITPNELARLSGTISYEIMLGFSNRVEKTWIE